MLWRSINAGLVILVGSILTPQAKAAAWTVVSREVGETAIVFRAGDVRERRLPVRIHGRNIPPLFGSQVVLDCLAIPAQPDDLLLYLPASRRCVPYDRHSSATRLPPVSTLPSALEPGGTDDRLERSDVIVLQPASTVGITAGACSCPISPPPPVNQRPVATVRSGNGQTVAALSAVDSLTFDATDADDTNLSHTFSYTLDGVPAPIGLPVGLGESCTSGSGSLSCIVDGTAPDQVGFYQIIFRVSDGSASASATASLTVVGPAPDERIFSDGFEPVP